MKKNMLVLGALAGCIISVSAIAQQLDNSLSYNPVTVPHASQITFDLLQGIPAGMQSGTNYNMICATSASGDSSLTLEQFPAGGFASWKKVLVNGQAVSNQFLLPKNATITIDGIRFVSNSGIFTIHNLDNTVDVTLRCAAVPVF